MNYLALDTSGPSCSVALELNGERVQRFENAGPQHSRQLPTLVSELLAECGIGLAQLDGIICCVGPGGFAGVRVGVAYTKGLALGLELPVAPVSSLALLAQAACETYDADRVITALDARMGEVYVADYRRQADTSLRTGIESVCAPAAVVVFKPEPTAHTPLKADCHCVAAGSGWARYADELRAACDFSISDYDAEAVPQALHAFAIIAKRGPAPFVDAEQLQPSYLRNRVAKTMQERAQEAGENVKQTR